MASKNTAQTWTSRLAGQGKAFEAAPVAEGSEEWGIRPATGGKVTARLGDMPHSLRKKIVKPEGR